MVSGHLIIVHALCYKHHLIDIKRGVKMITVIAKQPIVEGKMDEALGEFKKLMSKVAKEEGTVLYSLNIEKSNPNTLVIVEQYKDKDSLDFHSSTSYFKEFFAKAVSFAGGKPEIVIMEEISRV
jgi:quinol monooxygenase YgiN